MGSTVPALADFVDHPGDNGEAGPEVQDDTVARAYAELNDPTRPMVIGAPRLPKFLLPAPAEIKVETVERPTTADMLRRLFRLIADFATRVDIPLQIREILANLMVTSAEPVLFDRIYPVILKNEELYESLCLWLWLSIQTITLNGVQWKITDPRTTLKDKYVHLETGDPKQTTSIGFRDLLIHLYAHSFPVKD